MGPFGLPRDRGRGCRNPGWPTGDGPTRSPIRQARPTQPVAAGRKHRPFGQVDGEAGRWDSTMVTRQLPEPTPMRRTFDQRSRRESDLPIGPSPVGKPHRRTEDGWLERWMETVSDLARLKDSHPMLDAVIDEQVGRNIRIGDQWLADFASCNYLGFDLDEEIIASIPDYIARWGTHPSWSRLLGSPRMY